MLDSMFPSIVNDKQLLLPLTGAVDDWPTRWCERLNVPLHVTWCDSIIFISRPICLSLSFCDIKLIICHIWLDLFFTQANLAVQEARYEAAMKDLNKAQEQLDDKQRELEAVQAQYDQAMAEKQVRAKFWFWVLVTEFH